jgi:hypothetical protein
MGSLLGFITVFFILLSMTRKGVKLFLGKAIVKNKKLGRKTSFAVRFWLAMQRNHRYFGILALLSAFAHAAVQFSMTGLPSLTGATLVSLLIAQGITGYMQENKKGPQKLVSLLHTILPPIMLLLIVLHIIFNSTFINFLGIGG